MFKLSTPPICISVKLTNTSHYIPHTIFIDISMYLLVLKTIINQRKHTLKIVKFTLIIKILMIVQNACNCALQKITQSIWNVFLSRQ